MAPPKRGQPRSAGPHMTLHADNITCQFGGLKALDRVSIDAREGELLGLIGPNGSGKTTFFNVASGLYAASAGKLTFRNQDIAGMTPDRIVALGLARTFQTPRIYMRMTVQQNLEAAYFATHSDSRRIDPGARDSLLELLQQIDLADRADELAKNLPLADQRRLELVRTLVGDPSTILLDEPAGGMTPVETREITRLIREVVAPGRTCIVIEHKMDMIASLCERAVVLNFGQVIASGAPEKVLQDPVVLEAYLGRQEAG